MNLSSTECELGESQALCIAAFFRNQLTKMDKPVKAINPKILAANLKSARERLKRNGSG